MAVKSRPQLHLARSILSLRFKLSRFLITKVLSTGIGPETWSTARGAGWVLGFLHRTPESGHSLLQDSSTRATRTSHMGLKGIISITRSSTAWKMQATSFLKSFPAKCYLSRLRSHCPAVHKLTTSWKQSWNHASMISKPQDQRRRQTKTPGAMIWHQNFQAEHPLPHVTRTKTSRAWKGRKAKSNDQIHSRGNCVKRIHKMRPGKLFNSRYNFRHHALLETPRDFWSPPRLLIHIVKPVYASKLPLNRSGCPQL